MIIAADKNYKGLDEWLNDKSKVLLVCDSSLQFLASFVKKLDEIAIPIVRFSDFQPNPLYESAVKGVKVFREENCDSIIAVGGGSAIDVAKCIKLYSNYPGDGADGQWLKAETMPNNIPFLVMPTTAGTGSEATRYAVLYYEGAKQSITSESFIPDTVLMDPNALKTLPAYQRKATMCDALCHAIESFWSVNSTDESRKYSREAIQCVLKHMDGYLSNTEEGNAGMLQAAHMAGKAINITQTTAGHAMCYKITSLFGCAHGHAAILCDRVLYPWMIDNIDKCIDSRGAGYLKKTLDEIGIALGCADARSGATKLVEIFESLQFEIPKPNIDQYDALKNSVNPVRLKNHPIELDTITIDGIYHEIFEGKRSVISGATEAVKLLKRYGLYEQAMFECNKADCLVPLNMKKRNEIWSDFLGKHRIMLKKQLEERTRVHCEEMNNSCYPEYVVNKEQCISLKCQSYVDTIQPIVSEMSWISDVQKKLDDEGAHDEACR